MKVLAMMLMLAALCPKLFGQHRPAARRPAYEILRQNEDWSGRGEQDKSEAGDFFSPIKHISLGSDGSVWVSFGGQWRERLESWNQFNFGAPLRAVHNDSFLLSRMFLHTDLHLGEYVRVFVQEKSSFSTHRDLLGGRRTQDVDELDVQNGFVDLILPLSENDKFTMRAGRQELLFGRQRLVGPSDWTNTRRTFDGFSGIFNLRGWGVTAFWTRPVVVRKYDFNKNDPQTRFYGLYATGKVPNTQAGLDLYWLKLDSPAESFNGAGGRQHRHTLGSRVGGQLSRTGFDYELEVAYQFGSLGANSISASMVATQWGYKFSHARATPRLYVGYDFASGGASSGDTFNQLFPTAHSTLGYLDMVGRQNVMDLSTGGSFAPIRKLTVALDAHNLWRADADDAVYNKSGGVVRSGKGGTSKRIGSEIDLTAKYQWDRHTSIEGGYGHFFPGEFVRQSGPRESVDFGYLGVQFTF